MSTAEHAEVSRRDFLHIATGAVGTVGAAVTASSSKVGTVMDFSRVERQSLARYTQDAGNHVSVEVHPAATLSIQ